MRLEMRVNLEVVVDDNGKTYRGSSIQQYSCRQSTHIMNDSAYCYIIDVNFFDDTDPTKADVIQGWTIGAGIEVLNQAPLAIQFYDSVVNDLAHSTDYSIFDEKPSGLPTIELTGHSLGGGLAGLVASLSGDKAVIFDHMPYGAAAYKIVADHTLRTFWPVDFHLELTPLAA